MRDPFVTQNIDYYEKMLGRELSVEEKGWVQQYGVLHPSELAPDTQWDDESCPCGTINCKDSYAHTTSGW
jgi:hypothetical protein